MTAFPARVGLGVITAYQKLVSPVLRNNCRYQPTCSAYAYQAIERFGLRHGLWLVGRRLGRCHPFRPGGYDPVPPGDAER